MADDRDGMEDGPGSTGESGGNNPRAVSGHTVWHDSTTPLSATGRPHGRAAGRVVHPYPVIDGLEVRHVTIRATVWTEAGDTQEDLEAKLDRVFVGEVGPHLPVITYDYVYDEEGETP